MIVLANFSFLWCQLSCQHRFQFTYLWTVLLSGVNSFNRLKFKHVGDSPPHLSPNPNFGEGEAKRKSERERERAETFGAEHTVPVCYVKYASFLWSWVIIILGSYTVFICFKAVSKFCCLRVLLYSIGSWVLRWQVLCTRCRLFSSHSLQQNIKLPNTG